MPMPSVVSSNTERSVMGAPALKKAAAKVALGRGGADRWRVAVPVAAGVLGQQVGQLRTDGHAGGDRGEHPDADPSHGADGACVGSGLAEPGLRESEREL